MVGIAVTMIIILNLFTFAVIVWTKDTSALAYLIPSDLLEAGTATAFYYNKAKKENGIKLLRSQETLDAIKKLQEAGVDPAQFFAMFHEQ
ncbi:MAG TPA: hypothetical protein PLT28_00315 [Saprospiraceae bacterium]|nr:hypothetical protein [Saprospiraceae bacterium]